MNFHTTSRELRSLALYTLGATGLASAATAQVTFSIDHHGPTRNSLDTCGGIPITEGDILIPAAGTPMVGPLATPCITIDGGATGLGLAFFAPCPPIAPGLPCRVEVDALSYANDFPMGFSGPGSYLFSTDEFAIGGIAPVLFPSLASESPVGDSATDIWRNGGALPLGPLPPFAAPVGHLGVIDGDGTISGSGALYAGTGLIEPTFPGPPPNTGDNLDAMDYNESGSGGGFPSTGVYFSLDDVTPDALSGTFNSGTALGNGFSGADVLWTVAPGGPPVLYAPAAALGLDIAGNDDLDALALWENGTVNFQPSQQPNDWLAAGGPDMLLFSVRRGSAVIGMPSSNFGGIPITEGDILTTPLPTAFGGVSPFPAIYCAAENIGLSTLRSSGFSDDLNALDTILETTVDCNGNGVSDFLDILSGTSSDVNANGVPDDCELIGGPSCFCPNSVAVCGNPDPTAGCENSTGQGGFLTATGSGSVGADDLVLLASQMPSTVPSIFFGGTFFVGPLPFGDGLRCAGGNIRRFGAPAFTTATGTRTLGPGIAGTFGLVAGDTWIHQCWFRDTTGPCGNGFNTTNAYTVLMTP